LLSRPAPCALLPAEPHRLVVAERFAGRREEDAMDCCAHAHAGVRHPWMGSTPLASVGAMLAGAAGPRGSTEAARTAATRLARERK
jgi:hypothetical protein